MSESPTHSLGFQFRLECLVLIPLLWLLPRSMTLLYPSKLFAVYDKLTFEQRRTIHDAIAMAQDSLLSVLNLYSATIAPSGSTLPVATEIPVDTVLVAPSCPDVSVIAPPSSTFGVAVDPAIEQRVSVISTSDVAVNAPSHPVPLQPLGHQIRIRARPHSRQKTPTVLNTEHFEVTAQSVPLHPSLLNLRDRANISREQIARDLASTPTIARYSRYSGKRHIPVFGGANAALNMTSEGRSLTYRLAKSGPDTWDRADDVELSRLINSSTLHLIHAHDQPPDRRKDTTY